MADTVEATREMTPQEIDEIVGAARELRALLIRLKDVPPGELVGAILPAVMGMMSGSKPDGGFLEGVL